MKNGVYRVLRGGSVNRFTWDLRITNRFRYVPEDRHWYSGFRVAVRRRKT